MAYNRFGPQPIREIIWRAGFSHTVFAELTGVLPYSHVRLAIYGYCPPSEELRKRAAELLERPIEDLFTAESLAAFHQPRRTRGDRSLAHKKWMSS